ncbi:RNA-splicing ligase RtcB [Posidoniimonas corsicana]|uniref:3'-phosphate/5'-hydroxy nucleic acid ligase n=1 Tax=Posidoniimonas corsicana TaxID=1938618 RepID=A0A5C5V6Q2_9BACT|nr:RtcB family protein [Posidoniimonas corsicana]TWT33951.1 RNA-splicing ligase RtcB [Posidoniimonas corsicana]
MKPTPVEDYAGWLVDPLTPEAARSINRLQRADGVCAVAVMPDVHLSTGVCVGVAAAACGVVLPQAVGGDIGCGMAAVAFDAPATALDERSAARVLAACYEAVPAARRRGPAEPLPEPLRAAPLSDPALQKLARRDGAVQLGTLGRGNHFLELQADQEDRLWAMVHSGSRAMGQAVFRRHTEHAPVVGEGLLGLAPDDAAGRAYLNDAQWCARYAQENRLAMLRALEGVLRRVLGARADWGSLIHSDHNHVRLEAHDGQEVWMHRKGAQSAGGGEPGVVPGSMGTASFHTEGRGCAAALNSCSHGAGRRLSRTDARRAISRRAFEQQIDRVWIDRRRADRLLDEAPAAYKDIRQVMRAQRELCRVVRELRPVLNYKAG